VGSRVGEEDKLPSRAAGENVPSIDDSCERDSTEVRDLAQSPCTIWLGHVIAPSAVPVPVVDTWLWRWRSILLPSPPACPSVVLLSLGAVSPLLPLRTAHPPSSILLLASPAPLPPASSLPSLPELWFWSSPPWRTALPFHPQVPVRCSPHPTLLPGGARLIAQLHFDLNLVPQDPLRHPE
jgi:hypothetical protein